MPDKNAMFQNGKKLPKTATVWFSENINISVTSEISQVNNITCI